MAAIKAQCAFILLCDFQEKTGTMRPACFALGGIEQDTAQPMIAVTRVDCERVDIKARGSSRTQIG